VPQRVPARHGEAEGGMSEVACYTLIEIDGSEGFRNHRVRVCVTNLPKLKGKTRISLNGKSDTYYTQCDSGIPGLKIKVSK
jgi:hypothetical protein